MKDALNVLRQTFMTSLPLLAIMLIVTVFVAPFDDPAHYMQLGVGYVGVVLGQSLFLIGLNISVIPIGKEIGGALINIKKIAFVIFFGVMFGFFATVAEPAMWVLARQTNMIVSAVNITVFVIIMAAGIGICVGLALWRIIKDISIRIVFLVLYSIIFLMVIFVPDQFVALAFDGSGVTTGDISVPFILALGLGISAMCKTCKKEDNFGIIGIASAGPIMTVFLYGIILRVVYGGMPAEGAYNPEAQETAMALFTSSLSDTSIAIAPLLAAFIPFQIFLIKMKKSAFRRVMLGMIPVFAGLLIFLFAVDFGFAYAGGYIGETFMSPSRPGWFKWILPALGFVLGLSITLTEPGVKVLADELQGMIGIKSMNTRMILAVSIGFSATFAIVKIMLKIHILWFLAPLYLISIALMKFTSKLFVGLAFDSGGVVGGALSSALLTPLTLGIAQAVATAAGDGAQSVLTNGFGIFALISVTPLIAIQILGIVFEKEKHGTASKTR